MHLSSPKSALPYLAILGVFVVVSSAAAQMIGPMAPAPTPTPRLLPGQLPPKAPEISYKAGNLTVVADNSSLSAILHGVEKRTGIKLEGNAPEDRIFGKFGPGSPRDVLHQLFSGLHLDYILQGSTDPSSVEKITLNNRGAITAQMVGAVAPGRRPNPAANPDGQPEQAVAEPEAEADNDPMDQPVVEQTETTTENTGGDPEPQTQPGQVPTPPTPQELIERLHQLQNQQTGR